MTAGTVRVTIGDVTAGRPTVKGEPRYLLHWELGLPDGTRKSLTTSHGDKRVLQIFQGRLLYAARNGTRFDRVTGLPEGVSRPHPKETADDTAGRPLVLDIRDRLHERWNQPGCQGERKGHTMKALTNEAIAVGMALLRADAPELDLGQRKAARDWLRRQFVPADARERVAAADQAARAAARAAGPKDKQQKYRWRMADERAAARDEQRAADDAGWAEFFDRHGLRWFEVDPDAVRRAITALGLRVDGNPCEAQTFTKHFVVLNELMTWAVARRKLPANPTTFLEKWERPSTTTKVKRVDQRQVPGMDLLVRLIDTCRDLGLAGDATALRVVVFIALLALAGLRPSEARALRVRDFKLPARGWGNATFGRRTTTPGRLFTLDGKADESGGLRWRDPTDTRDVPLPPMLVEIVRRHVEQFGLGGDDYLVCDDDRDQLKPADIDDVWHRVRETVFAAPELSAFRNLQLKDLRHTRATLVLAARAIPELVIALWLGHHTSVLRSMYEGVISGSSNPYSDEINRYRDQLVPPEYDGAALRPGASEDALRMLRQAIASGADHRLLLTLVDALAVVPAEAAVVADASRNAAAAPGDAAARSASHLAVVR